LIEHNWDLTFEPRQRREEDWRDELRSAVEAAVRRQMVSDVPLGSFLSGGIDSSAIVAAMRTTEERVSTWTIGFNREDLRHEIVPDDLKYAREVGAWFGTDYHEQILEPDILELLPN
jgi:asparagine synthase (glutamine-hydrolysing)